MKFSDCIVNKLVELKIIPEATCVQSVSFTPPAPYDQYDCSVRINNPNVIMKKNINTPCAMISECCVIGNYINLQLVWNELIYVLTEYIANDSEYLYGVCDNNFNGKRIAVEHTSITPVYPINLATFRSSIIGEAIKNLLEFLGAEVETHFFVEDMARQLELLSRGVKNVKNGLDSLSKCDKIDHFIGRIFTTTYASCKNNALVIEKLHTMFPKSRDVVLENDVDMSASLASAERRKLCEKCLEGHKETLRYTGIQIDSYDYESDFTLDFNFDDLKEPGVLQSLIAHSEKIPYYLRNCAYFSGIRSRYDEFYTVISDRQRAAINDTLDSLKSTAGISVVFFGDVLISDDDEKNALDSIKEGVFHSVDQYIETMSELYGKPQELIVKALKFKLLSTKLSKGCYIDDSDADQYDSFFEIYSFVEDLKGEYSLDNIEEMEYNDSIKPLCTKIIQFEDIIQRITIDKNFNLLTDYVASLFLEVRTYISMNNYKAISDKRLRDTIVKIFNIAFKILDIE